MTLNLLFVSRVRRERCVTGTDHAGLDPKRRFRNKNSLSFLEKNKEFQMVID
jgi:hypothetical protein